MAEPISSIFCNVLSENGSCILIYSFAQQQTGHVDEAHLLMQSELLLSLVSVLMYSENECCVGVVGCELHVAVDDHQEKLEVFEVALYLLEEGLKQEHWVL